ncbi:nidogen-1-like protein, partial [Leptotrombidium deliense]
VNTNGILSFITELPSYFGTPFPLTYPIIAPFYADVDTRKTGTENQLLERASQTIRNFFSKGQNFRARSLFIATWDKVSHFNQGRERKNTFQVVVASDGSSSYVFFLYPENGIQWIRGDGKVPHMPDARAQAGFMSGDGRMYILPGSGSDRIQRYDRKSNVNDAGFWVFHIGNTGNRGNVENPDIVVQKPAPNNCAETSDPCAMNSKCVDYRNGFCCHCADGYFGNGRECFENDKFQRLFGKLNGYINKKTLQNIALHSHTETRDGRSYTGISRIPADLGPDMQTLFTIGSNIGWIFAKPRIGAKNGFVLTGGLFNRTVDIEFRNTGDHIHMKEYYVGPDVFGYINVNIEVRGSLPPIPYRSKVTIDDFADVYTRQSNNVIRSQSEKMLKVGDTRVEIPFSIDQTIEFEECVALSEEMRQQASRLEASRQMLTYDDKEQIVRYTGMYAVSPLNSNEKANLKNNVNFSLLHPLGDDPCIRAKDTCGAHSTCIVDGSSFKCVCQKGFEMNRDSKSCVDVDECALNRHVCDVNAVCSNAIGRYDCRCRPGFKGDGFRCEREQSCEELRCHPTLAMCVKNANGENECVCKDGYRGNGRVCESINEVDGMDCYGMLCDKNAACLEDPEEGPGFKCYCKEGYSGTGEYCVPEHDVCETCHQFAECLFDRQTRTNYCACRRGYTGDGYTCAVEDCNTASNCHPKAQCIQDTHSRRYNCQCLPGYIGNGFQCREDTAEPDCSTQRLCSSDATCVENPQTGKSVCVCRPGYEGNGMVCRPLECRSNEDCHPNSRCDYDYAVRRYKCQCNPGFEAMGNECKPATSTPDCTVLTNYCHEKAMCKLDPQTRRHKCECREGWKGDGRSCVREEACIRCDEKADCLLNTASNKLECVCLPGFEGNGYTCRPIRSCIEDRSVCDGNADCTYIPETRSYGCHCKAGYVGDGRQCILIPLQQSGEYLIFAQGMSLLQMPLNPSESQKGQLLLTRSHHLPVGIDVDCMDRYVYWSDVFNHTIYKTPYNGSETEQIFDYMTDAPEGIAIDWISRNIYWTDSRKDAIQVATLDGRFVRTVISGQLVDPRGIAVHPGFGKLFWTDWNREAPKIETSALDGSDRELFVSNDLGLPNMLTIDYHSNDLCWTDAGLKRIECKNIHSPSRRVVYTPAAYPFDITIAKNDIYWTDWEQKFISKVNKYGGAVQELDLPLGGNGKTYGIVTVSQFCPRMTNACAARNGGCPYFCLPNGRGSRTCQCPDPETAGYEECTSG